MASSCGSFLCKRVAQLLPGVSFGDFYKKTALIPDLKVGVFDRAVFGIRKLQCNLLSQKSRGFLWIENSSWERWSFPPSEFSIIKRKIYKTIMIPVIIMIFEENESFQKVGEIVGFICLYLLFTTILFLILNFLHKIQESWSFVHLMAITFGVALVGIGIRYRLE